MILMPLPAELEPRDLTLRAMLAVGARAARRVLPIVARPQGSTPLACEDAVAMADACAAGESAGALESARVVADLQFQTVELRTKIDGAPAVWDARDACLVLARAAEQLFRANDLRAPSSEAAVHARQALSSAWDAAAAGPDDGDAMRQSIGSDLARLRLTHPGSPEDLGPAVDLSHAGHLGPLWAGETPDWYSRHSWTTPARPLRVETLRDSLMSDTTYRPDGLPQIVCWYTNEEDPDWLFPNVERALIEFRRFAGLPAAVVICAPNITPGAREALIEAGAIVVTDRTRLGRIVEDSESLREALVFAVENIAGDWLVDERGLWRPNPSRNRWRRPVEPPAWVPPPSRDEISADEESARESAEPEPAVSYEDYASVLRFLNGDGSRSEY